MAAVRKLIVEVVDAQNLLPKDGHGTSSPYAVLDFHRQRRKTRTAICDLNPTWNESLEFNVGKTSEVFGDVLVLDVFHDKNVGPTTWNKFLGRVRLSASQFVKKGEEALIYYPLEKKSLLSWIQGEIGLKIYFSDEIAPLPPPPPPPPPAEAAPANPPPPPADVAAPAPVPPEEKLADEASATAPPEEKPAAEAEAEAAPPPPPEDPASENDKIQPPPPPPPPVDQVMASISSAAMPELKFNNKINGPQPISRVSSVSSFIPDQSDRSSTIERSTFDLVDKMHYLFVRLVRARSLPMVHMNC